MSFASSNVDPTVFFINYFIKLYLFLDISIYIGTIGKNNVYTYRLWISGFQINIVFTVIKIIEHLTC